LHLKHGKEVRNGRPHDGSAATIMPTAAAPLFDSTAQGAALPGARAGSVRTDSAVLPPYTQDDDLMISKREVGNRAGKGICRFGGDPDGQRCSCSRILQRVGGPADKE
jgi:hypothetical protein